TSNGSCAADPCGSLTSTPAGVPVSTTTTSTTTTTTQAQTQCCVRSSPMGAFLDTCMLLTPAECSAQGGLNIGPGDCSTKPCPPGGATTTTAPATTTTTTTRSSTTTTAAGSTTTTGTGMCPTT